MFSQVNFFKVGRIDEIIDSGWIRVTLLGWDIVVLFQDREFIAIERSSMNNSDFKTFLPDGALYSKSGSPNFIDKFLAGPAGTLWGKLRHFPVRIKDDYVFVGVVQ